MNKWWETHKMTAVMGAGFLLRLIYVSFSTIYDRQYDIGRIDLAAGHPITGGHLAYIQYLYENWHLPDFDPTTVYQFNHPPLHHFISALWLKFASFFIKDTALLEESLQIVPFVCSLLILAVLLGILRRLSMTEGTRCFLMLLFSFHPALILFAGSVNNDCMSLLFTLLCVHSVLVWADRPCLHTILYAALSVSLGMLTKQNVAEMAFPMGLVMGYVFVKKGILGGLSGKLARQFMLFGAVSIPLGMSFYVRNKILYHMPLVWVYTLPEDSWQYTGNVPLYHRFLWPDMTEFADNLRHFKIGCGYNVWMQIIRTSVLGEWDMANVGRSVKGLAVLLMLAGAILAAAALIALLEVFVLHPKKYCVSTTVRLLFLSAYLVNLIFYLLFVYRYPQECSMHFRYITIELLFPAVALGLVRQQTERKWLRWGLDAVFVCFCILSGAMVGVWCLA